MDIFEHFLVVATILEETIKLLPKNGRILALIALISVILYSFLSLVFNFSTMSLFSDMLVKQYSLGASGGYGSAAIANPFEGILKDVRLLFLVDISFLIGIYIVSLFTTIATVIISAASYNSKSLASNDLVLQFAKSWIRPLITSFYTTLLGTGYIFMVTILVMPLLTVSKTYMFSIAMVIGVIAGVFYLYLNVVWILAMVVSLMEENNYGIQGLGRAGILMEGKKLQGFILNISLNLLSLILTIGIKMILGKKLMANQTVFWICVSIFSCLMRILQWAAYTVLYFHCKKDNGEEMGVQNSVSYKKLSNEPPFTDAA